MLPFHHHFWWILKGFFLPRRLIFEENSDSAVSFSPLVMVSRSKLMINSRWWLHSQVRITLPFFFRKVLRCGRTHRPQRSAMEVLNSVTTAPAKILESLSREVLGPAMRFARDFESSMPVHFCSIFPDILMSAFLCSAALVRMVGFVSPQTRIHYQSIKLGRCCYASSCIPFRLKVSLKYAPCVENIFWSIAFRWFWVRIPRSHAPANPAVADSCRALLALLRDGVSQTCLWLHCEPEIFITCNSLSIKRDRWPSIRKFRKFQIRKLLAGSCSFRSNTWVTSIYSQVSPLCFPHQSAIQCSDQTQASF